MPVASLALLLPPLLQCLHFPVSGPCPRSPFSLLTLLPSLFPISLLTSLPSLRPHPVIPASPAGTQQQRPLSVHRPFMVSLSNHIPAPVEPHPRASLPRTRSGAGTQRHPTIPPLPALMVSPSNHTPCTLHPEIPKPPIPPLMVSLSNHTPRPRPLHPPKRQFTLVPFAPQNRQKSAPRRPKSFLEKTLIARETPTSGDPHFHHLQPPTPLQPSPNPAHRRPPTTGDNQPCPRPAHASARAGDQRHPSVPPLCAA